MKKIRIQRVSAFDIAVTLLLAVVFIALAVRGTGELAKMKTTTDDFGQPRSAMMTSQNLSCTDRYAMQLTDCGQSIFKDADQALYHVKQNGRHGCGFY